MFGLCLSSQPSSHTDPLVTTILWQCFFYNIHPLWAWLFFFFLSVKELQSARLQSKPTEPFPWPSSIIQLVIYRAVSMCGCCLLFGPVRVNCCIRPLGNCRSPHRNKNKSLAGFRGKWQAHGRGRTFLLNDNDNNSSQAERKRCEFLRSPYFTVCSLSLFSSLTSIKKSYNGGSRLAGLPFM